MEDIEQILAEYQRLLESDEPSREKRLEKIDEYLSLAMVPEKKKAERDVYDFDETILIREDIGNNGDGEQFKSRWDRTLFDEEKCLYDHTLGRGGSQHSYYPDRCSFEKQAERYGKVHFGDSVHFNFPQLTRLQNQILTYRDVRKLPYAQIAKIMHRKQTALRSLYYRAKRTLRHVSPNKYRGNFF